MHPRKRQWGREGQQEPYDLSAVKGIVERVPHRTTEQIVNAPAPQAGCLRTHAARVVVNIFNLLQSAEFRWTLVYTARTHERSLPDVQSLGGVCEKEGKWRGVITCTWAALTDLGE